MAGRLTRWFDDRIRELRRPAQPESAVPHDAPQGDDGARLLELESLRDEARRLEGNGDLTPSVPLSLREEGEETTGGGEPACLAKVREALQRDRKPAMRAALRAVLSELGGGE